MTELIISHSIGITLVGGGPVSQADLAQSLGMAPLLVAADGGADRALAAGNVPHWAIGDLDSISAGARSRIGDRILHDTCQNTTDFEKCLARLSSPLTIGLGFLGGRVDHELAALAVLARHPATLVLMGAEDLVVRAPERLALDLTPGTRLSLFAMGPVSGRSTGLEWPIDAVDFQPGRGGATSNRATGPVGLSFDGAGMLLILPRAALTPLLAALR